MRPFIKSILGFSIVLSVFVVSMPARAAALTSDQVNAVIGLLESFNVSSSTLATVNAVLNHLPTPSVGGDHVGTSTSGMMPPGQMGKMLCIGLSRNLSVGSQGDDVKSLQDMLRDDGDGFTASSTGFFGPLTAQAMARFQTHNGIASSTTGFVGPLTRAFFSRGCGGGSGNGQGDMRGPGMMGSTTQNGGMPPPPMMNSGNGDR